jgi:hypothetical protein
LSSPEVFDYRRHFLFLAGAIVILGCLSRLPLYGDALFAFAVNGALHGCAVVSSLKAAASWQRELIFVVLAALLSIMTLYVAIIVLVALSILPDSQRLPAVIGIAAMTGAVTYGSLVRWFWIRGVRPRTILGLATFCALATVGGYFLKLKFNWEGTWWMAVIWWVTFSLSVRLMRVPPGVTARVPAVRQGR